MKVKLSKRLFRPFPQQPWKLIQLQLQLLLQLQIHLQIHLQIYYAALPYTIYITLRCLPYTTLITVYYSTLQLQCQLHYITQHSTTYTTLITVHYKVTTTTATATTKQPYTTLHYTTQHYTILHYSTQHYTTQHNTTLHYTTLITPHHNYNCNCNYTTLITLHCNYNSTTQQLQLQLHYTMLHPAVVSEVTTATIATTPKNTTPATFRSISGFALPFVIHHNQPLL